MQVDTDEPLPWDQLCGPLQELEVEVKQADLLTVQFPDTSRSQLPVMVGHTLRQVSNGSEAGLVRLQVHVTSLC